MKRKIVIALAAACCAVAFALDASAQQTVNYGSISGRVVDAQGGAVPGASVVAKDTDTNVSAEATTDMEGRFRFAYLRVGPYVVTVHLDGFKDATRPLDLTVGSAFDLPVTLQVAGVAASVEVVAETPVLDTARTQVAQTVEQTEVQNLPLNGRNFLDIALVVPGVSPTNLGSTQLFAETSAVPGNGLSVSSQRNLSNSFIVDGLSANDDAAGLSSITYGVDAVDQFQVVTSGGQAEFGRALGGYINVVTKSGTNTEHGSAYEYFRDDALNAANPLLGRALPMHQNQYGFSIGGPIRKDRTFYFGNVEQRRLEQSGLTTISDANVAAINARLDATGYPGSDVSTGLYPNPVHTTNILAKVDHEVSSRDQFTARFAQYGVSADNSRGAGGTAAPSASAALDNVDRSVAFGNTLTLSGSTINETRAQMVFGDLKAPPTDAVGPAVSISGIASFGTLSGSPTRRVNRMYEIVDNLTHQVGDHSLRTGIDLLYNDDTITYPRSVRGSYSFGSLAAFQSAAYSSFSQTFGVNQVSQTNPNLGVYVQDEWRVASDVTLNAGVRYDLQWLKTINTDTNNVAPRVGVSWLPFGSSRTVVRASAGLFYDRVPLRPLANALLSAGNTTDLNNLQQISVSLSPTQTGAPVFPAILPAAVPTVTLVSFSTMDRNLQSAHSRQASVEVERQLGERTTVSAAYQYLRGLDLLMSVNQNVPTCVASGSNNGCRPDPTYQNNSQYSSAGDSTYHGLTLSWVQRPMRWGYYRVSYTLSKAMDDLGEFFFSSPLDATNIRLDWGRSDDDQRHRFVLSGGVNSPTGVPESAWEWLTYNFQLSGSVQYYSHLPLNITLTLPASQTIQTSSSRPVLDGQIIPRNSGVGPDYFSVNARLSRKLLTGNRAQVELLAEGFNLTNRENVVSMIGNFGTGAYPTSPAATYRQITAVSDPRSFQFAVRATF